MDVRARYTRELITNTFLELLEQKPMEKITVTEICQKADINRTTFYKHFLDIYDLLEQLEKEALSLFDRLLLECAEKEPKKILTAVLETLQKHGKVIASISSHNPDDSFFICLQEHCYDAIHSLLTFVRLSELPPTERELTLNFIAHGVSGAISAWLAGGMASPPEEAAEIIETICQRIIPVKA